MVKVCIVKSCPSGRKKKAGRGKYAVSFFRPSTTAKLQRWAQSLEIDLKASDYVCQHHFKEEHIKLYDEIKLGNDVFLSYALRKTLKEDALPTVQHQSYIIKPLNQIKPPIQGQEPVTNAQGEHVYDGEQYKSEQQQQEYEHEKEQNIENKMHQDEVEIQLSDPFQPLRHIKTKIEESSILPPCWCYAEKPNRLEFIRIDPESKQIINHLLLNTDFTITVVFSNNEEETLSDTITSVDDIHKYLKYVERWPRCVGTQVEKRKYANQCKGLIIGDEAYKRHQVNPRCKSCRALRGQLLSRIK